MIEMFYSRSDTIHKRLLGCEKWEEELLSKLEVLPKYAEDLII